MKPFKIGIWVGPNYIPETGGGFSYTEKLIEYINLKQFDKSLEIVFVGFSSEGKAQKPILNLPYSENYFVSKRNNFFHKFFSISLGRNDIEKNYTRAVEILKQNDIQLIFYPNPCVILPKFPYIFVHWDLGHKSMYSFPEVAMNNVYEMREQDSGRVLNKAIFICCESETGRSEVIKYYDINQNRIKILPLFPGKIIDKAIISKKPSWLDKDADFFFYPAQFWAHKNHYNLIVALKNLLKKYPENAYKLILPGSDRGNLTYIKEVIRDLNMEAFVSTPGFIGIEELKWLYENAIGLVFPSFLGPTNMPLLEALHLGCNVACSELEGHKEILKDHAIYFAPENPASITEAMDKLIMNRNQPKIKIDSAESIPDILEKIFLESIPIRRTWGQNDKIY